jgi:plastocyanin
MPVHTPRRALVVIALWLVAASPAAAGQMLVLVQDSSGAPVEDAVVTLTPADPAALPPPKPATGIVDQVNLEFVPYVTLIGAGTMVTFPNSDNVRHHVYSFSPAKTFELPLYAGATAPSVLFDKPGVVALGCNIHDWMIGYIYVTATPYAARTGKDGKAAIAGPPAGDYLGRVWHPRQEGPEEATVRRIHVTEAGGEVEWRLSLKADLRIPRGSVSKGFGY